MVNPALTPGLPWRDRQSLAPWVIASLAAVGMLFSAWSLTQSIPHELAGAAHALLDKRGLSMLRISADGRDLTLDGSLPRRSGMNPDRAELRQSLLALPGVLSVHDALQATAATPPTALPTSLAEQSTSASPGGEPEAELARIDSQQLRFSSGTTTLAAPAGPVLDSLALLLERHPRVHLRIEGHTDNTGADAVNLTISTQRAGAVADALVARGIESQRLIVRGFGATRPVASNDENDGRARNRRIELSLIN